MISSWHLFFIKACRAHSRISERIWSRGNASGKLEYSRFISSSSGQTRCYRKYAAPYISFFMWFASDIATCLHYTGIDPFSKEQVYVAKGNRDRKMQRALMQSFKPENYFMVREALIQAGRSDLIGGGCDALIPAHPPKEAIEARRRRANQAARGEEKEGDHYHTVANPAKGEQPGERGLNKGYRPGRRTAGKQDKRKGRGRAQ